VVNLLSRKQENFDQDDWLKIKRIFRYLQGTINLGLRYRSEGENLECYADASLGVSDESGKSTSGLLIKVFNDVIYWRTKKQSHIALSSAEAEFIAMSLACKELVGVWEMCRKLIKVDMTPILFEDNSSAIKIAKSDESQALKHIVKLCYHYVRLEVKNKNVIVRWISTHDQIADMFTKALGKEKFEKFRNCILHSMNE
jgi:hypothetical protein